VSTPIGINMSEAEYSWGSFPTTPDLNFIDSSKITLIRLPIAWERVQPTLNGPLDATYVAAMKAFITLAGSRGKKVIVDVHNYGRYNKNWAASVASGANVAPGTGDIIGSPALPMDS
jgi:aryl-phospho-beta-D-glucosidase BglC (GH1 family)